MSFSKSDYLYCIICNNPTHPNMIYKLVYSINQVFTYNCCLECVLKYGSN